MQFMKHVLPRFISPRRPGWFREERKYRRSMTRQGERRLEGDRKKDVQKGLRRVRSSLLAVAAHTAAMLSTLD